MRRTILLCAFVVPTVVIASGVQAGLIEYSFQPTPADLYDLDHHWAYVWGISPDMGPAEVVTSAELTFHEIRNWNSGSNVLYVSLLDDATVGVSGFWDNQGGGDFFAGNPQLVVYEDLPNVAQTLTYSFTDAQLALLQEYLYDGVFGLGFDPDCHFYNQGVELTVTTTPDVPEPATMAIFAAGTAVVLSRRGRRRPASELK